MQPCCANQQYDPGLKKRRERDRPVKRKNSHAKRNADVPVADLGGVNDLWISAPPVIKGQQAIRQLDGAESAPMPMTAESSADTLRLRFASQLFGEGFGSKRHSLVLSDKRAATGVAASECTVKRGALIPFWLPYRIAY